MSAAFEKNKMAAELERGQILPPDLVRDQCLARRLSPGKAELLIQRLLQKSGRIELTFYSARRAADRFASRAAAFG